MSRAIIFANGHLPNPDRVNSILRADDFLLAVDAGARHILALGLMPHLVIGDLDSLSEDDLYELSNADVKVHQHPSEKDETDLELALQYTLRAGYCEIRIVAALGGRLDQTLGNLVLLTEPSLASLDIRLDDGVEEAFFCRSQVQIHGRSGDLVSLIPWGYEVGGVLTESLKWSLCGETLFPYKTRGISNEMLRETATIQINSGLLLIVHRRL